MASADCCAAQPLALNLLAIVIPFAAATIILTLQNFAMVTMTFRRRCLRTARAVGCYRLRSKRHVGGGRFALLRRSYGPEGAELSRGHHRRVTNSDKRRFVPIE